MNISQTEQAEICNKVLLKLDSRFVTKILLSRLLSLFLTTIGGWKLGK
jgi:hypothetical protein